MSLKPSRRKLLAVLLTLVVGGGAAGVLPHLIAADTPAAPAAAAPAPAAPPGGVNVEGLGKALASLGLKATRTESRFDFLFASKHEDNEWELSMSAVLSNDQKSIWLMAWLDECPANATEVPRNALLRLLGDNDKLGSGKFFAFVQSNRRFVLQRVILNSGITKDSIRADLLDLGKTVIITHPHWNVAQWKNLNPAAPTTAADGKSGADVKTSAQAAPAAPSTAGPKPAATATKPAAGARK